MRENRMFSIHPEFYSEQIKNRLHLIKGTKFLIPQILERFLCFPDIHAKVFLLVAVAANRDDAPTKLMI